MLLPAADRAQCQGADAAHVLPRRVQPAPHVRGRGSAGPAGRHRRQPVLLQPGAFLTNM